MRKGKQAGPGWLDSIPESDRMLLAGFFSGLARRVVLAPDWAARLRGDFERAFQRYAAMGVGLNEGMRRLDPSRLGGFYARPPTLWYPLDDAAKIYPMSMKRRQMAVFRLSACMKEEVVPELLQMALNFTVKRFPSFATTVKKGFFWHYLDAAKRRFTVEPETGIPCSPLDVATSVSQSFRVLYHHKRISVEFFHVLTDGTGGMSFLKTLVAEYLRLLGVPVPCTDGVLDVNEAVPMAETANDYPKAEPTGKASRESMNEMMNATVGMVRALRHVPLFLKRLVAGLVFGFLGDRVFSNTLSNLGVVRVPAEMAAHVEEMDFILGPAVTNRAACGLLSFGNTAVLSVAKCTADPAFEERLYDLLRADGLEPRMRGSELYGH